MKIQLSQKYKQAAGSLVTVLVISAVLSLSVGYYLSLVEQQSLLSARSQSWNMAMTISEAGLEEGLEQLNSNAGNLASDGWYYDGALYWHTNTMPDHNAYTVNIDYSNPSMPILVARAYVNPSGQYQSSVFAAAGAGASTASTTLTRAIRVKASRGSLFLNALVAKDFIDLNGNGISTDSYDSGDPSKSTNGKYDPNKLNPGDMGDVAANAGIVNALSIGNANIYGHARVGPGGTDQIGSNGKIGEHTWQAVNSSGAEPGWFSADANFTFPDTSFPYTATSNGVMTSAPGGNVVTTTYTYRTNFTTTTTTNSIYPTAGTYLGNVSSNLVSPPPHYVYIYAAITGTTYTTNTIYATNYYDHILVAGASYYMNSLSGSTYVAGLDVRLVVSGGADLRQPFVIGQNAAIQVWSGGNSLELSGNSGANQSGYAGAFILYCPPSVTSFTLTGNGQFTGVLVMPGVNVTLNGSGSGEQDFCGSIMAKSVTLTGHFNFHYDEALRRLDNQGRYLVKTWDEIP